MHWTLVLTLLSSATAALGAHWTHSVDLDHNYSVFWTPAQHDITFELQVRTLGYVGFGFSQDGKMPGADMVIGWVRDDQVFFQDRYAVGRGVPEVDPSQDYELLLGYENGTHTVIRFRRRYDTCDHHDYKITSDTIRLMYAYHNVDPLGPKQSLNYHGSEQRGALSLYLMERANRDESNVWDLLTWDLRNPAISLPVPGETLYWCKIFRLPTISTKHHMIKYEPLHEEGNRAYMHHVIVYECQGNDVEFEAHARDRGQVCYQPHRPSVFFNCNNLVVAWATGSQGFSFPVEAGYPLDPHSYCKYYMMETHYSSPSHNSGAGIANSSGIRIYYTPSLRAHDAGVLSVGMDPNWRHIIPPGQPKVVSEGHCISDCTKQTLPSTGIQIFGVILHTHLIGRKIRFRQIRNGVEQPPIAVDNNYDFNYQESRRLQKAVTVYPGDHLIAECVYNSEGRSTITLGGLTTREEMCLVYGLYYPRIDLSLCHSLPSLPTVLHSLGIQQLMSGSSPVKIKSPPELANMTLENRLVTYDWENNFHSFQEATHQGSFKPLCWTNKPSLLLGVEDFEAFYPNISIPFEEANRCHNRRKKPRRRKKPEGDPVDDDAEERNVKDTESVETVNSIGTGAQESSRLNNRSRVLRSSVLVSAFVLGVASICR